MADKIITTITEDDGVIVKTQKDGRHSDEVIKDLPIKVKKNTYLVDEVNRKLKKEGV